MNIRPRPGDTSRSSNPEHLPIRARFARPFSCHGDARAHAWSWRPWPNPGAKNANTTSASGCQAHAGGSRRHCQTRSQADAGRPHHSLPRGGPRRPPLVVPKSSHWCHRRQLLGPAEAGPRQQSNGLLRHTGSGAAQGATPDQATRPMPLAPGRPAEPTVNQRLCAPSTPPLRVQQPNCISER